MKREDYITWGEFFMGVALVAAQRSKDPNTQVGSCIVNNKNHIVGVGYNGFPVGCSDDEFPWDKPEKYPFIAHSELNAIINNISGLEDCIMYCTLFPCNECAKAIIQSGIKEVIYLSDKYHNTNSSAAARKMFDAAGVKCTQFQSNRANLTINFTEEKND